MNKNMLKKLNGFYAKCLRRILKVSPSFISRVSNQFVLHQFHAVPLSRILLQRQLYLFGRISRLPADSVVRACVFEHDGVSMKCQADKKRGRPRNTWAVEVHKMALKVANGSRLSEKIASKTTWEADVKKFCSAI